MFMRNSDVAHTDVPKQVIMLKCLHPNKKELYLICTQRHQ